MPLSGRRNGSSAVLVERRQGMSLCGLMITLRIILGSRLSRHAGLGRSHLLLPSAQRIQMRIGFGSSRRRPRRWHSGRRRRCGCGGWRAWPTGRLRWSGSVCVSRDISLSASRLSLRRNSSPGLGGVTWRSGAKSRCVLRPRRHRSYGRVLDHWMTLIHFLCDDPRFASEP